MTAKATQGAISAWTNKREPVPAAADLAEQFRDVQPEAILFFCSHHHDGGPLSKALKDRYPKAQVVGCTTAGELTQAKSEVDSVSAIALSSDKVVRCSAALARCEDGAQKGVAEATAQLSSNLKVNLRELDGKRWVGVVLVEGLKMREEEINEQLGNHAPLISFVGGSAGDNLEFKETRVFCNGEVCKDGAALLLMEMAVPFMVTKTCSFESTGNVWRVTRADEKTRTIYEVDGKPIAQVYSAALTTTPDKLNGGIFMSHPVGLLIDGKPWIRSPQQLLPDGGLRFYCKVSEGMSIHLMRSTDLVADTQRLLDRAPAELGHPLSGALAFNCILRRLELDAKKQHGAFLQAFKGLQVAGFHTYGESWLGHINQTLTAILFA
jgi:hypothetical protein